MGSEIALPQHDAPDWAAAVRQLAIPLVLLMIVALSLGISEVIRRPTAPLATRPDSKCWPFKPTEKAFAQKINASRAAAGKSRLSLDPELSKVATVHTQTMVSKDLLHHQAEADLRRRVLNWSSLGENVGVGANPDTLHEAFMNSPAHRSNILHTSFRHSGIGVIEANGRMWVTVLFESTSDPHTSLAMPRC